ncbi:MAG: Alpha-ribazole phosphatase [Syntrophorhabdus sp. PtaU1.Bin058]|nr:MAG: Alpha-ribazole phosphatase [Syntrophorhabdus sp. PtaU1.Bin058]
MKLYIVRHGETASNGEEVFRGRKDIPLNQTGKRQAALSDCYFVDKGIRRILSSSLSRAVETAEGISRTTAVPIETIEEFVDMDFGVCGRGLNCGRLKDRIQRSFRSGRDYPRSFAPGKVRGSVMSAAGRGEHFERRSPANRTPLS